MKNHRLQMKSALALELALICLWSVDSLAMNLQRVTHVGQSIDAVIADGDYAYIGEGAGLRILDVSNPANPQPKGRVGLLAFCKSVAKHADYIYCAILDRGLQVVDVSNPNLPEVVFTYEVSRNIDGGVWWSDVEVEGNRLYIASGNGGAQSGIHCFNIADPASPSLIGHFSEVRSFSEGITVKDNLVYAGTNFPNGLQIIDFTDPGNPLEVGYFLPNSNFMIEDLVIDGDLAYTAASFQDGMVVLDISTPDSVQVVGSYNTPNLAWNIRKFGNYVYVSDMWDNPGVLVINVTNPSNPVLVTTLQVPGTALKGIWIDQTKLYVASLTHLSIFSLSNPSSPILIGSYSQRDQLGHPWGVRAKDGYLYVSDFRMGLKIFDIADPSNPVYLGKYRVSTEAEGVEIVGNAAYVCNVFGHGIETIDVSDKSNPIRTNILSLPQAGRVQNAVASGDYLYVAENDHGIYVVNISNPLTPTYETRFDTNGVAQDVAVVGNALFVADGDAGVKVLDLSNAPNLSLLTSITNIGNVVALDVDGSRAIVGIRGPSVWEVRSYDISNVGSPDFKDSLHSWSPFGVKISGKYALVQNHKAGIWAYDITDLSNLVKVSEFDTEASCDRGIDIDGDYIYSCDWLGGLNIFTITGGLGAPTPTPTVSRTSTVLPSPTVTSTLTLPATSTPLSTSTPYPTYTFPAPAPSYTPYPTNSPFPTYTDAPTCEPASTHAPGDVTGDGEVNHDDLLEVLRFWQTTAGSN